MNEEEIRAKQADLYSNAKDSTRIDTGSAILELAAAVYEIANQLRSRTELEARRFFAR